MDEPVEKILNRELSEEAQAYLDEYAWRGCGYTGWQVAYALDHYNSKAEEAVRRILTEENGSGMMTNELVRGVLISHRSDFHELLGRLLLAAGLQEGLRQVICENADYGTKAGFFTILKVIAENHQPFRRSGGGEHNGIHQRHGNADGKHQKRRQELADHGPRQADRRRQQRLIGLLPLLLAEQPHGQDRQHQQRGDGIQG